jgi:ABC-type phosphate transport system auxiliary subunit
MDHMKAHVGKMEAQLRRWGLKLDKLQDKSKEVGTAAKADYLRSLDELIRKHRTVRTRLDELKAAGLAQWKSLRGGVDSAWQDLDRTLKNMLK